MAVRKAISRATSTIVEAIVTSGNTIHQQALALRSACLHPTTLKLTKSAGLLFLTADDETKRQLFEQIETTLKEVLSTGNRQRINADCSTYAEVLMSSMVGCGAKIKQISRILDIDHKSCKQLFSNGKEARVENVKATLANWSQKVTLSGFSKLTTEIKCSLNVWIREHPNVRPSPITRDTLLVKNKATGQKERVGKLLLGSWLGNCITTCCFH
jgi:uncharacterized protein YlaN (UPF0358 family)